MKILKPKWVTHGHPKDEKIESCAIFSVDIHPDGTRFATGGQGEDSGRVVIWNMAPLLSEAKEMDARVPQMLCTLDNHLACVNAVRWSHSGRYLASGGDDKLIMIWTKSKSQGSTIFGGGKGKVNVEHWKCSHILHGHTGDVLDIAWSPQDVWLATASVDNNIVIWNAERFPEIVTVLKGHTGLVKGVTWDPVGKYLSSQGDDRTLRVWRTADWQSEAIIEEPFKQCAGSTIMLRCAWSPDGQYIVSAHSLNNGGPTAQVIEREGWACDKDYVGHRKAVTAVRFIPNLVKRKCGIGSHQKTRHLSVLAIGSRDHGVSVWLGGYPRPLVVMEDLFSAAVLDLSWSPSGLALLACSYDGTLACFLFTAGEIGHPISGSERNELYEKMYGTCVKMSNNSLGGLAGGGGNLLIENCELLPEADLKAEVVNKEPPMNKEPEKARPFPLNTTPVAVDINVSRESVPDEVLENGVLVRTSSSSCHKPYPSPTRKQIETRTSDGRRRITPIYIPPTPDSCDGPAPFGSEPVLQTGDRKISKTVTSGVVIERRVEVTPASTPVQAVSTGSVFVTSTPTKDPASQLQSSLARPPRLKRPSDCESSREPQQYKRLRLDQAESPGVSKMCRVEREEIVTVIKGDTGGVNLPALSIRSLQEFNVPQGGLLIVDNKAYNLAKGTIVSVKLMKNSSVVWEHVFGYKILGVSTSEKLVALALLDTSVYVIDIHRGTFKTPTLYLGALATHVVLNNTGYLMVITNIGDCSVWNVNTHKSILSKVSLAPLFSQCSLDKKNAEPSSVRIKYGTLSDSGVPMLALTSGKAFVYSVDYACWSLVADSTSSVTRNLSQQIKLTSASGNARSGLPLSTLHANCQNNSRSLSIHNSEVSPLCTQSLLEAQLSSCLTLRSATEYRQWLLSAVHYYLVSGSEHRLRCLCEDLLGPSHAYATLSSSWEPTIMGLDKHSLLDEILVEVGKSIHSQRLYTEFRDQLSHVRSLASKLKSISSNETTKPAPTYRRSYTANIASITGTVGNPSSCRTYGNALSSDKINANNREIINPANAASERIPSIRASTESAPTPEDSPNAAQTSIAENRSAMDVDTDLTSRENCEKNSTKVSGAIEKAAGNNTLSNCSLEDNVGTMSASLSESIKSTLPTSNGNVNVEKYIDGVGNQQNRKVLGAKNIVDEPMEVISIDENEVDMKFTASQSEIDPNLSKAVENASSVVGRIPESGNKVDNITDTKKTSATNEEIIVVHESSKTVSTKVTVDVVKDAKKVSESCKINPKKVDSSATLNKVSVPELNKTPSESNLVEKKSIETDETNAVIFKETQQSVGATTKTNTKLKPASVQKKIAALGVSIKDSPAKSDLTVTSVKANESKSNTASKSIGAPLTNTLSTPGKSSSQNNCESQTKTPAPSEEKKPQSTLPTTVSTPKTLTPLESTPKASPAEVKPAKETSPPAQTPKASQHSTSTKTSQSLVSKPSDPVKQQTVKPSQPLNISTKSNKPPN